MCGIVGYIGQQNAAPVILEGLKRLEYRGYDSAGIAICNERNQLTVRRAKGKLVNLETMIVDSPIEGLYGLGHTRWATHGRPSEDNAHPHRDCTGDFVVAHNGIIENYIALNRGLIEKGHRFVSATDTEVLPHLIESYYQGDLEAALRCALKDIEGVYGIVAVCTM